MSRKDVEKALKMCGSPMTYRQFWKKVKLTEEGKSAITEAGGTTEDIEAVQEAVDEKKLGDKLKEATEGALDAYDDIKNNAKIQTIAIVVEGVNQVK